MLQALLSKWLLPIVGVVSLVSVIALGIQTWRLKNANTEIDTLTTTVASYKATIETMQKAEKLRAELGKRVVADKAMREKDLARQLNLIEGTPTNEKVSPAFRNDVMRLYREP